jgi:hypothetical protein
MIPPILFLTFNRPDTTARVFDAIRAARPARLYVAGDGPRADRPGEAERCAEVRHLATQIDWPCEVKTLFRDQNLGCRHAVHSAITWFFEHEPEGIILEDDCLPDPSFFMFCGEMLDRYRENPRIMCVTGNNFQSDMRGWPHSYYYSIYNHCWGWASWRRAWTLYDAELDLLDDPAAREKLRAVSSVPGFEAFWTSTLQKVRDGSISAWDYPWTWSCFLHGGLTCTPSVNLVSNIGFGKEATHTTNEASHLANMPTSVLSPPYDAPSGVKAAQVFDDHVTRTHFGVRKKSYMSRLARRLRNALRQLLKVRKAS